ncbi:MAG: suppressor of fused domain protein [Myxococcales bacterium]
MAEGVLLEDVSPNGNVVARVEQDERCAYFYLAGEASGPFGIRSCWVRNLAKAPETLDAAAMKDGDAPMLPAAACAHPDGATALIAEDLRVVWFEEGDAAALYEGESVLAIIPGWSGLQGFEGYARDCRAKTPFCWPLPSDSPLLPKLGRAARFWAEWRDGAPWQAIQQSAVVAIEAGLGKSLNCYSIDGGEWPPKALVRVPRGGATVLASCGVSIRPQPKVDLAEGSPPRRIELAMAVENAYFDRAPKAFLGWLAGLCELPWASFRWLGPGMVVPCEPLPMTPTGVRFEAALLAEGPQGAPAITYPAYRGDAVRLLWVLPITAKERELAEKAGGAALLEKLCADGKGWTLRYREPVVP